LANDQVALWVAGAILKGSDPQKRARLVKHFILAAEVC
jgi:hypothetical protein